MPWSWSDIGWCKSPEVGAGDYTLLQEQQVLLTSELVFQLKMSNSNGLLNGILIII